MRAIAVPLSLLVVLASFALFPPAAGDHGEGVAHGTLFTGLLPPSETITRHLEFSGRPLRGGWVFLLVARVYGAPLQAALTVQGEAAGSWTIPTTPDARWAATTLLPRDGTYDLTLTNTGGLNSSFAMYFDQSCDCAGKFIPAEIPDGMIIFNTDVAEPAVLLAQFNEPRAMRVRVSAAVLEDSRGLWPDDFEVLAVSTAPVQRTVKPELPPVWLHELRLDIDRASRLYFFVEGVRFDGTNYTGSQDLLMSPLFEASPRSGAEGVVPWLLLGAAVALAVFGVLLLLRGRSEGASSQPEPGKRVNRRDGGRGGSGKRTARRSRRRRR